MKALLAVVLALALVPALAPTASAGHVGPCYHEYVEALLYQGPKAFLWTIGPCVENSLCWLLCQTLP